MSATGVALDVVRELRAICGEEHVVEHSPERVQRTSTDTVDFAQLGIGRESVSIIDVAPGSPEEIAAVLRLANARGVTVAPAGGGTEQDPGSMRADVVIHTHRLIEIEHYDHGDLTVGVGAGTTVANLSSMVGEDNLMFAADPPLPERCTIGGLLATAAHGPLRHGYGTVRDFCIGVRFVTGDGRKAKGGGRVVKNVAGYDLMKLLIGSYGTLGIITSASFKLFPAPRQTSTFLAEFASAGEAIRYRDVILHSPLAPMCLELVSPGARKLMRPEMTSDAWVICMRAAGSDAVLARYRKELGSAITREVEGDSEQKMWRAIEDFPISEQTKRFPQLLHFMARYNVTAPLSEVESVINMVSGYSSPGSFGVGNGRARGRGAHPGNHVARRP